MELILWRHAEAGEGHDDLQRELTDKGRRQAEKMAKWLKRQIGEKSLQLVASEALRSQQTLAALSQNYRVEPGLNPGASATAYMDLCRCACGTDDLVIVVGHQPEIGRAASLLLTGHESDWSVKKGAVWWLRQSEDPDGLRYELRGMITPQMLNSKG